MASKRRFDGALTLIFIWPVSTKGKNSFPMKGIRSKDKKKAAITGQTILERLFKAQPSMKLYLSKTLSSHQSNALIFLSIKLSKGLSNLRIFIDEKSLGRNHTHIIGTNVLERTNDVNIANPTARVSGRNKNPPIPGRNANGANTIKVVRAETIIGINTSWLPSIAD